jgi:hypothetical protein
MTARTTESHRIAQPSKTQEATKKLVEQMLASFAAVLDRELHHKIEARELLQADKIRQLVDSEIAKLYPAIKSGRSLEARIKRLERATKLADQILAALDARKKEKSAAPRKKATP